MSYFNELTRAMTWLGEKEDTIFIGQCVKYPGNALFNTLNNVPQEKRIEMPVAEEMQMGISIGLSLMGKLPISIYPRMDFLMCAMNQLVNHLDKIEQFSNSQYKSKIMIRTCIGSTKPLHPGVQHCSDYTEGIRALLHNVNVVKLSKGDIEEAYCKAYYDLASTILIEEADLYGVE